MPSGGVEKREGSLTAYVDFVGPLQGRLGSRDIKIDFTLVETMIFPVVPRPILAGFSDQVDQAMPSYALEEILTEKLCATIGRTEPRDIYDLHFLLGLSGIDFHLIPAAFAAKARSKGVDPLRLEGALRRPAVQRMWETRLGHQVRDLPHLEVVGVACHIGSQILSVEPFARACEVMVRIAGVITDMGVRLKFIDLGGGLGIPYHRPDDHAPTPTEYAEAVMPVFRKGITAAGISPSLWIEPGRSLVADSTILLTRVNSVKTAHRTFVNIDAGFNLLVRPVMYDSYHEVLTANRADQRGTTLCTVAGPICETGDILASDRFLPDPVAGDILALLDCGAYGFAMSSQYNSRPRCPEILLKGNMAALMRRGETTSDLTCTMQSPPWQKQD